MKKINWGTTGLEEKDVHGKINGEEVCHIRVHFNATIGKDEYYPTIWPFCDFMYAGTGAGGVYLGCFKTIEEAKGAVSEKLEKLFLFLS